MPMNQSGYLFTVNDKHIEYTDFAGEPCCLCADPIAVGNRYLCESCSLESEGVALKVMADVDRTRDESLDGT